MEKEVGVCAHVFACVCVLACWLDGWLAGFAPADRVMDLFLATCGLCVMYEIHLKFSVLNEALTCLHVGEYGLKGKWIGLIFVVIIAAKRPDCGLLSHF